MDEENINNEDIEETQEEEQQNPLEMSDDDILNMAPDAFEPKIEEPVNEKEEVQEEEESSSEEEPESIKEDKTFSEENTEETVVENEEITTKEEEEGTSKTESLEKSPEIDYKLEYEKIMAPFKAGGQDIKVQSIDEAVRLMQMGVGFNKKTASIKELKRKIQPLEEYNLLTEDNISLFIDLVAKKDQNALKKLIKDFGVEPMDIDTENSSEYKPNTYTADESQLELDEVLDDLRDSTHYTNVLDVVGNRWDEKSKHTVVQKPHIMKDLEEHMRTGIYDKVNTEVERQRMFGNLNGMSDIDAYNAIGAQMTQQGLLQEQKAPLQQPPAAIVPQQPVTQQTQNSPELNSRRKAAATTKSMPSGQKPSKPNPLGMSDDDFLKQSF